MDSRGECSSIGQPTPACEVGDTGCARGIHLRGIGRLAGFTIGAGPALTQVYERDGDEKRTPEL
jgi:hypothetical protein